MKFLEAAKSLEADFLRKQTYCRVNHPQEVTKEVNFKVWRVLCCSFACRCSNALLKQKADTWLNVSLLYMYDNL